MDLGEESVLAAPSNPMIGPGGLQNLSAISRNMAARGEATKQEEVTEKNEDKSSVPLILPQDESDNSLSAVVENLAVGAVRTRRTPSPDIVEPSVRKVHLFKMGGLGLDETFGLVIIAFVVYSCRSFGLPGWSLVVLTSVGAFVLWHFRDRLPERCFGFELPTTKRLVRHMYKFQFDWCPPRVRRLIILITMWRFGSILFGAATLALITRRFVVLLTAIATGLAYVPVHESDRRPAAIVRVIISAVFALGLLTLLDVAFGPDASATLVGVACFSQPSLDVLDRKLARRVPHKHPSLSTLPGLNVRKKNDISSTLTTPTRKIECSRQNKEPSDDHFFQNTHQNTEHHATHTAGIFCSKALRARNLGVVLLAIDADTTDLFFADTIDSGHLHDTRSVLSTTTAFYLGFFGAWFVAVRKGGSSNDARFVYVNF